VKVKVLVSCLAEFVLATRAVGSHTYVKEDQEAQGPAPPLKGEPR
jgi:hypothetical protein